MTALQDRAGRALMVAEIAGRYADGFGDIEQAAEDVGWLLGEVKQLETDAAPRETPDPYIQEKGADGYYRLVPNPDRETPAGAARMSKREEAAILDHAFDGVMGRNIGPREAAVIAETPAGAVEALADALWAANNYDPLAKYANVKRAEVEKFARDILAELSGYSLTRSVDVERWQRIETAARGFLLDADAWYDALRDALRGGLGRERI